MRYAATEHLDHLSYSDKTRGLNPQLLLTPESAVATGETRNLGANLHLHLQS